MEVMRALVCPGFGHDAQMHPRATLCGMVWQGARASMVKMGSTHKMASLFPVGGVRPGVRGASTRPPGVVWQGARASMVRNGKLEQRIRSVWCQHTGRAPARRGSREARGARRGSGHWRTFYVSTLGPSGVWFRCLCEGVCSFDI